MDWQKVPLPVGNPPLVRINIQPGSMDEFLLLAEYSSAV